jgi:O-antigen/teichoic acid export membrane protein
MPPNVYGELTLGMTIATLLSQIILGPLSGAALRFFAPAQEDGELEAFLIALRRLLAKATGLVLLLAGSVSLVLLLLGRVYWIGMVAVAFGFALLSGYNSTLNGLQNAARQRIVVAWHQALYSWSHFLAATGLVLWIGPSSTVAMLGYGLSTLMVLFSQLWFFHRTIPSSSNALSIRTKIGLFWENKMFAYALPFAAWGIFYWAQMASDRWALQLFAGAQDVGLYAVLYQLGYYPITLLTGLMVKLISPVFFQRAGDASDASRVHRVYVLNWQLTIGSLLLTGAATLLAVGLHRFVFHWLVASEYREVSCFLPGVVLAGGLFATGQFASVSLLSDNRPHRLITPKIATAVIGALLNFLGAKLLGVLGVVLAGVSFSGLYCLWVLLLVRGASDSSCWLE